MNKVKENMRVNQLKLSYIHVLTDLFILSLNGDRPCHDRMVVGFTTNYLCNPFLSPLML